MADHTFHEPTRDPVRDPAHRATHNVPPADTSPTRWIWGTILGVLVLVLVLFFVFGAVETTVDPVSGVETAPVVEDPAPAPAPAETAPVAPAD